MQGRPYFNVGKGKREKERSGVGVRVGGRQWPGTQVHPLSCVMKLEVDLLVRLLCYLASHSYSPKEGAAGWSIRQQLPFLLLAIDLSALL